MLTTTEQTRPGAGPAASSIPAGANRVGAVVLGMHRAGTSVLTGMLAGLGWAVPKTLMGATDDNPAGYFESRAIADFNDGLLKAARSSWCDWSAFDPAAIPADRWPAYREAAAALIGSEYERARCFAMKDPRLCRLGRFWLRVLADAGIETAVIVPLRNPVEVAASLSQRDGLAATDATLLWLRHVLDAEAASRGRPRAFVTYDQLLADWRSVAAELEVRLGITWPRGLRHAAAEVDAFIRQEHRHHELPIDALDCPRPLRELAVACHDILQSWAADGEDRSRRRDLDQVREEFERLSLVLRAVSVEREQKLEASSARARQLERSVAREREARMAAEAHAKGLLAEHARTVAALVGVCHKAPLPGRLRQVLSRHLVARAGIVDPAWYATTYADVASSTLSPNEHFALFGYREGRPPRPLPGPSKR